MSDWVFVYHYHYHHQELTGIILNCLLQKIMFVVFLVPYVNARLPWSEKSHREIFERFCTFQDLGTYSFFVLCLSTTSWQSIKNLTVLHVSSYTIQRFFVTNCSTSLVGYWMLLVPDQHFGIRGWFLLPRFPHVLSAFIIKMCSDFLTLCFKLNSRSQRYSLPNTDGSKKAFFLISGNSVPSYRISHCFKKCTTLAAENT
jgi:hypothetical protein